MLPSRPNLFVGWQVHARLKLQLKSTLLHKKKNIFEKITQQLNKLENKVGSCTGIGKRVCERQICLCWISRDLTLAVPTPKCCVPDTIAHPLFLALTNPRTYHSPTHSLTDSLTPIHYSFA